MEKGPVNPGAKAAATALYNQGFELWKQGRLEDAIAAYDAALALCPDYPEALCAGGFLLHQAGKHEQALRFYDEALRHRPDYAIALANRGELLAERGASEAAIESLKASLRADPTHAPAWSNLGTVLNELGRYAEALPSFDEAARLDPGLAQAFYNRGHAHLKLHHLEQALADFEHAARLKPNYAEAVCGRAVALKELGWLDDSAAAFEAALALDPGADHTLANKGALLLLRGRFEEGLDLYERRWAKGKTPAQKLPLPYLDRIEDLRPGEKVLVWDDQALGDVLQFSRYLPLLAENGANVVLLVRKSAHRLLACLGKGIEIVERVASLEGFARHVALGSLPRAFHANLATIPAPCPYLRAEAEKVRHWRNRIGAGGFKIGISWQGTTDARADIMRSFPLAAFAGISRMAGVRLISLQKGDVASASTQASSDIPVEFLGPDFDDGPDAFIDTAAAMDSLDLVISCDTSLVHLAGALGTPVWVALKKVPEWRWLLERSDSPWYPTMRLYRQHERDGWTSVFEQMERDLAAILRARSGGCDGVVEVPCSVGELIDKLTILEIKSERITDLAKRDNVRKELGFLRAIRTARHLFAPRLAPIEGQLREVNGHLWDVEDALRRCEKDSDFGSRFVELARQVYLTNDRRAALKRQIDDLFHSTIVEEKSYAA